MIPLVQNSNSLLEDLRRLNQLRDIDIQNNIDKKEADNLKNDYQQQKIVGKLKR